MGGPRLTEQQILRIAQLARQGGLSSRRIEAILEKESPDGIAPDYTTIARYIKRVPLPAGGVIPWGLGWPDDPVEIAYLFRLLSLGLDMDWDMARWALRLRVVLGPYESDKDLVRHLAVVMLYAWRDVERIVLGKDMDTADLDAYLMFRAWESKERAEQYWTAVRAGRVPAISDERQLRAWVLIEHGQDSEHLTRLEELGGWGYLGWLHKTGESQEQERLIPQEEELLKALIDVVLDMSTDPKGRTEFSLAEGIIAAIDAERRKEEKGGQNEGKSSEAGEVLGADP